MAKPRPGGNDNCYDKTQDLTLTQRERAAGWAIETCVSCERGRRRPMITCGLCGGRGAIKVFNGDSFGKGKPGRPKKDDAA